MWKKVVFSFLLLLLISSSWRDQYQVKERGSRYSPSPVHRRIFGHSQQGKKMNSTLTPIQTEQLTADHLGSDPYSHQQQGSAQHFEFDNQVRIALCIGKLILFRFLLVSSQIIGWTDYAPGMPGNSRRGEIQSEHGKATSCRLQSDSASLQCQGILSGWRGNASRSRSRPPHPRKGNSIIDPASYFLPRQKRFPRLDRRSRCRATTACPWIIPCHSFATSFTLLNDLLKRRRNSSMEHLPTARIASITSRQPAALGRTDLCGSYSSRVWIVWSSTCCLLPKRLNDLSIEIYSHLQD